MVMVTTKKGMKMAYDETVEAVKMLSAVTALDRPLTGLRIKRLTDVLCSLTTEEKARLRLETCWQGGNSSTRFGLSKCRVGRCKKLGVGRNTSDNKELQIWAVWS
jgi:hypothetical protein